jgi:hypothetical protein
MVVYYSPDIDDDSDSSSDEEEEVPPPTTTVVQRGQGGGKQLRMPATAWVQHQVILIFDLMPSIKTSSLNA